MNRVTVAQRIREVVEGIEGMLAAYAPDDNGETRIPGGIAEFPVAIVLPGRVVEYRQNPGGSHRSEYEMTVLLIVAPPSELGEAAYAALPFVDRFIAAFASHLALSGAATYARLERTSGLGVLEWGGQQYSGEEIVLLVDETETVTFARGSAA